MVSNYVFRFFLNNCCCFGFFKGKINILFSGLTAAEYCCKNLNMASLQIREKLPFLNRKHSN